jgi:hypothetical protein
LQAQVAGQTRARCQRQKLAHRPPELPAEQAQARVQARVLARVQAQALGARIAASLAAPASLPGSPVPVGPGQHRSVLFAVGNRYWVAIGAPQPARRRHLQLPSAKQHLLVRNARGWLKCREGVIFVQRSGSDAWTPGLLVGGWLPYRCRGSRAIGFSPPRCLGCAKKLIHKQVTMAPGGQELL